MKRKTKVQRERERLLMYTHFRHHAEYRKRETINNSNFVNGQFPLILHSPSWCQGNAAHTHSRDLPVTKSFLATSEQVQLNVNQYIHHNEECLFEEVLIRAKSCSRENRQQSRDIRPWDTEHKHVGNYIQQLHLSITHTTG